MTVKELIDILVRIPSDHVVVIEDVDTGWWLHVTKINKHSDERTVVLECVHSPVKDK